MAKLPACFDWKKSPAHLDLLGKFIKPRDIAQVLNWQYLKDSIRENTKDAIDRFIRDGALVPCELEEGIDRLFTAAQLKKMLKDLGQKQSGTKEELVERIIETNRVEMDRLISRSKIMKCSASGLAIVEQYEQEKQHDIELAKQLSYNALMRGDPKEAAKIYVACNRRYTDPDFSSSPYEVGELGSILSSSPKVLGDIGPADLRQLQSAACMAKLWFDTPATDWLPDGFTTRLKSNKVAVNYLTRHADLRYSVITNSEYSNRFRIVFELNDIDSCELCLALNGKEFDKRNLPELPFEGCTSETGCMCSIETIYDDDGEDLEVEFDDNDDVGEDGQVAITKLRQLKEMLDGGLISQAEYDAKKVEILSRF